MCWRADTSIAARNGGCFPASASVRLESGVTRSMAELSVGDRVLTVDSDGRPRYDTVITFIHRQPHLLTAFTALATVAGHRLVATGDHLVFTSRDQSAASFGDAARPSFAAHVQPGNDSVYVSVAGRLGVSMVTSVTMVMGRGVFAPLTRSGTIVVDGVAASCYALVSSHGVAHASMAPLRLAASAGAPVDWWAWSSASSVDGVHWYARLLSRLTHLLLPADSDLWFAS